LCRPNGRHIATGPRTDHHHIKGFRRHINVLATRMSELVYR
jgi:hypothetical protein